MACLKVPDPFQLVKVAWAVEASPAASFRRWQESFTLVETNRVDADS
jgi:hypothetical protein